MPLTPDEAARHRLTLAQPEAEKHFDRIDSAIKCHTPPVEVAILDMSREAMAIVRKEYISKGWNVKEDRNQLIFSVPKQQWRWQD